MRKVPDALIRISVVIAALIVAAVTTRFFLLPASLTDRDYHKKSTIEREISRRLEFAGSDVCLDCHDQGIEIRRGFHSTVSCETCHGPAQGHVDDLATKPSAPRERRFCSVCHTYDPSRPTGFPQINPVAHNPMKPCISCHDPHDPEPPETPRECRGCHAEIARTMSVSHHVLLECTTCHTAGEGHRISPRAERATKPLQREFCGKCHDEGQEGFETLKVDMGTHGGRYLCWQCHYPHLPEG